MFVNVHLGGVGAANVTEARAGAGQTRKEMHCPAHGSRPAALQCSGTRAQLYHLTSGLPQSTGRDCGLWRLGRE